jgi:hypothetical protein
MYPTPMNLERGIFSQIHFPINKVLGTFEKSQKYHSWDWDFVFWEKSRKKIQNSFERGLY